MNAAKKALSLMLIKLSFPMLNIPTKLYTVINI